MASREQLIDWITEAEAARHRLMTGMQTVTVRDSNGESITFSTANASRLDQYILQLKSELAALGSPRPRGPLRPMFG